MGGEGRERERPKWKNLLADDAVGHCAVSRSSDSHQNALEWLLLILHGERRLREENLWRQETRSSVEVHVKRQQLGWGDKTHTVRKLSGRQEKQFTLTNTRGTEGMSPKSLTSAAGWMAFPSTGPEKTWGGNLSGKSCKKSDFGFKHNDFETHPRFLHTNTT